MTGTRFSAIRRVERREQRGVGTIRADDERDDRSGNILLWHIHRHAARIRRRTAVDDALRGIGRVDHRARSGLTRDTRIDLAGGRLHREVVNRAARHAFLDGHLARGAIRRPDDEVAIRVRRWDRTVWKFPRVDIAGRVRIAGGIGRPVGARGWRLSRGARLRRSGVLRHRNRQAHQNGEHDCKDQWCVSHGHVYIGRLPLSASQPRITR